MKTRVEINLNDVNKIKRFINAARSFESDINIVAERVRIDGKSILGLFNADLSKPAQAIIISDNETEILRFNELMKEFE